MTEREQDTYRCGHPRTPENTYIVNASDGIIRKCCRTCRKNASRRQSAAKSVERRMFGNVVNGFLAKFPCGHRKSGANARIDIEIQGDEIVERISCKRCEREAEPVKVRIVTPTLETMAFCAHCASGECGHSGGCFATVQTPRENRAHVKSGVCACGSAWSIDWPALVASAGRNEFLLRVA